MAPSSLLPESGLLLTDLYQLNMMQAYFEHGMIQDAVFEFFVRKLPRRRGFLMAAGLEQVLDFLENLAFAPDELEWLKASGRFSADFIDRLADLRFGGSVHAMPEGTVFFADEPILRVTAPLPVAQLVETRIINLLHFQTVIAAKAARMVLAAPGKLLVDFGLRRAHGAEAGLLAARAAWLAGFSGTATMAAGARFGLPIFGTMAHSFIQAHDSEDAAFLSFARSRPENLVLLLDTYDTERAARRVVALAPRLAAEGITVRGVRLDSGDLARLARQVRAILDAGGLPQVTIFASGGLDEDQLQAFRAVSAPIDGYGIGTSLTTSADVPALDCAYKLQEYAGVARRKRSQGKATWPGPKQVWRRFDGAGVLAGDLVTLDGAAPPVAFDDAKPLLRPVMRDGCRLESGDLAAARALASKELAALPEPLRRLEDFAYPVAIADELCALAAEVDRREAAAQGA